MTRLPNQLSAASAALAASLMLAPAAQAARVACPPEILNPKPGAETSPTLTIKATADASGNCDPNPKIVRLYVVHRDSGRYVYETEWKRGKGLTTGRMFTTGQLLVDHTVPAGELGRGERYRVIVQYDFAPLAGKPKSANVDFRTAAATQTTQRHEQQEGGSTDLTVSLDASRLDCVSLGMELADQLVVWASNEGNKKLTDAASVGLYLSPDPTIDTSDTLLVGGREHVRNIGGGETVRVGLEGRAQVPTDIQPGSYHLGALIDGSNDISESNERNNADSVALDIGEARSCLPENWGEGVDAQSPVEETPKKIPESADTGTKRRIKNVEQQLPEIAK